MNARLECAAIAVASLCAGIAWGGELQARVYLNREGSSMDLWLSGRQGELIHAHPPGVPGMVSFSVKDIRQVDFTWPAAVARAEQAWMTAKWDEARNHLRPLVTDALDYVDLPGSAENLVLRYAEACRRSGNYAAASDTYRQLAEKARPESASRAALWEAYCLVRGGDSNAAAARLEGREPADHRDRNFALYHLVRGLIHQARGDKMDALDHVTRSLSAQGLADETYPETLFVAASCYGAVKVLPGRVETNNVDGLARDVDAVWNAEEENADLSKVAEAIYEQLRRQFPENEWAKQVPVEAKPPVGATSRSAGESKEKRKHERTKS